jgi:hypothetical protein
MAMMISKFNSLIRSRLLWGVFLVVIVLSFVVWGMPSCTREAGERALSGTEGTLGGEDVSPAEFRAAYRMACLDVMLKTGSDNLLHTEGFSAQLREMAWQRLASLKQAAKWNLRAAQGELQESIRRNFAGQDGAFDRAAYDQFYQQRVMPAGFSRAQFEAYFAEEIVLRKLDAVLASQARVAPAEVARMFHSLMDSLVADYAKIDAAPLEAALEVSEDDARALFDENPDRFRLPEKRSALWTLVPDGDGAGIEVSDAEIEDYYNENSDEYETTETAEDGSVSSSFKPLDEVRGEIGAKLRAERAREASEAAAEELCSAAMPGRDGTKPNFEEVVKGRGLECRAAEAFAAGDDPVPEYGAAFVREAFARELGPFDAVSDPIPVEGGWVVLKLTDIIDPRTPEFGEVRDEATAAAKAKALEKALADKAGELRAAAEAEGGSLAKAAEAAGLEVVSPAAFTGFEATSGDDPALAALAGALATVNPGELAGPVNVPGGVIVGYLKERVAAADSVFETHRAEIENALLQRRAAEMSALWRESLLEGLVDLHPAVTADDEDVEEGADGEAAEEETAE